MTKTAGEWITEGNWQAVEDGFNNMPFVKRFGVVVSLADPDCPRITLEKVEDYHLGGIGQNFINGAITSGVIDLAIGLTGLRHAPKGYFATSSLHIDLNKPVEHTGFYATARTTQQIGKNLFSEATVFSLDGEPRVHATGVVRVGIRR